MDNDCFDMDYVVLLNNYMYNNFNYNIKMGLCPFFNQDLNGFDSLNVKNTILFECKCLNMYDKKILHKFFNVKKLNV